MGNVVEKTTGGPPTASSSDFDHGGGTTASSSLATSSHSGFHSEGEEGCGGQHSSATTTTAPYRRYYPKSSAHPYHISHQHAPSTSSSQGGGRAPDLFRNSCPLFDQAASSPLRKRPRATPGTTNVEETSSLPSGPGGAPSIPQLWSSSTPPSQSPYSRLSKRQHHSGDLSQASTTMHKSTTPVSSTRIPTSMMTSASGTACLVENDIMLEDDDESAPSLRKAFASGGGGSGSTTLAPSGAGGGGGPITKAVISRGLRARFKSFSAWLLSEPAKASFPNSASFPSGFGGGSLKRWSSLRASFSFQTASSSSKSRREASQRSSSNTPSKTTTTSASKSRPQPEGLSQQQSMCGWTPSRLRSLLRCPIRRPLWRSVRSPSGHFLISTSGSVASLNSLSDGRTPWPVPWLEAIFLPEFPSKGAVNEKAFTIVGTIAKGAFGKVYRVSLKASPEKIFAMKVQSKSDVITQNAIQQIKDEVSIHQMFADYPFIAQLYCTWQSRSKLYIVLQYVAGYGDLYQLWRDEGPFNEDAARIWGAELAMALDFMHANGVIYRDLKMENIMLDDNGHVQLVDFGLAKWLYYGDRTSTICGTLQYMAPEVLQGELYNHAADWWSLGVLLHTLMCGSYPYSGADSHTSVKIDDYVPPASLSLEAQTLLSKLLRKDPNWRLRSFTVYKTQSFFKGISLDAIRNKTLHPFDYIPRMRRCNTCNVVSEDIEGLEDSDLAMFHEDYEALKNFDSFCGEENL